MLSSRHLATLFALALTAAACAARNEDGAAEPRGGRRMALSAVGDSVLYFEQTGSVATMVAINGDTVESRSNEDEVFLVARVAPDTLVATYEYMRIRVETGGRVLPVPTQALLGRPFVLAEENGRVRTVRAPELPEESGLRDLTQQFEDFFMPVPAQPLDIGLIWVDTLRHEEAIGAGGARRSAVTRYRVTGDTTVHGIEGRVVSYESALESVMYGGGGPSDVRTELVGTETGTIVYSPERRIMLARVRNVALEGTVRVESPSGPRELPHWFRFGSSVEALPAPAAGEPVVPPAAVDSAATVRTEH